MADPMRPYADLAPVIAAHEARWNSPPAARLR